MYIYIYTLSTDIIQLFKLFKKLETYTSPNFRNCRNFKTPISKHQDIEMSSFQTSQIQNVIFRFPKPQIINYNI